jgi:hypothetical protein
MKGKQDDVERRKRGGDEYTSSEQLKKGKVLAI